MGRWRRRRRKKDRKGRWRRRRQRELQTITGPGPSFLKYLNVGRAADLKGTMSYRTEGGISVHP